MADERDPQVSQHYGKLGSEEPPAALDDAILAASRRAAAPRRRWYIPLAAAAAAVLAVGVALHVQREQPEPETVTAPAEVKEAAPATKPQPAPAVRQEPAFRYRKQEAHPDAERRDMAREPVDRAARAKPMQDAPSAPAAAPAPGGVLGATVYESPERWLERIAELRKEGRHDEADKALAEFRRRYPDYRMPQETLERIERK
jgi:hypothetical protein